MRSEETLAVASTGPVRLGTSLTDFSSPAPVEWFDNELLYEHHGLRYPRSAASCRDDIPLESRDKRGG